MKLDEYATPGPLTTLTDEQTDAVRALGLAPLDICRIAQGLLVDPHDALGAGLSEERLVERNTRPATTLFARATEIDGSTLTGVRPAERRVVGTCRHFAVLAAAFLRATSVPARARCGFATYSVVGKAVDHWIVEHWSSEHARWIRTDPEYLDRETALGATTADLRPGEFFSAGEAWQLVRSGKRDPLDFGVFGTENWGACEIRGNAMRDLASVAEKLEMLPWDEWGPMKDSYRNETGPEFDLLIDALAVATADPDGADLAAIYAQLAVPPHLIG